MKCTNFIIWLICCVGFSNCRIQCDYDHCNCYNEQSDIEIQCPKNFSDYGGFLIHILKEESILIDCVNGSSMNFGAFSDLDEPSSEMKTLTSFEIDWLPNISVENGINFKIRSCPLPDTNYKSIIDKFSVKDLKSLEIEISENLTLDGTYFENLGTIKMLKVDVSDGMLNIAKNAFDNTPNLSTIDLKGDNIKLTANVFQPTPLLTSLDITQSNLDKLPEGIFRNLRYLKVLSLWSNELTEIDEFVFADLENLKMLELSHNKIMNISEDAFKNLVNLQAIAIARNNLTALPFTLFQANTKLETISLYDNFYLNLSDYLLANLKALNEVCISNCKLESIPEHLFENSTNITKIDLENNLLTNLPEMIFRGLEKLKILNLQNNKIENISNTLRFLKKLKVLNLQNNLITSIEKNTFKYLGNIETINLSNNKISQIHYLAFNHEAMGNLKVIDLSHNQISEPYGLFPGVNYAMFQNVIRITDINLSYNRITRIDDVINLENKVKLKILDLRHNAIDEVIVRNLLTLLPSGNKLKVNLDWNNISTVNFALADQVGAEEELDAYHNSKVAYTVVSLANNPIECDCSNYDLFRYFQDDMSPKVKTLFEIKTDNVTCVSPYNNEPYPITSFPVSLVICPIDHVIENYSGCPHGCSCYWRPSERSFIVDCSYNNFTTLPDIILPSTRLIGYNQTELIFDHNKLIEGPKPNMTGYNNVTKLLLFNNKIKSISWLPPKLEILQLHNNSLSKVSYEVFKVLNTTKFFNVTLNDNPWTCDCNAENLTNLLRQKRYVDGRHVYCENTSTPLISLSRKDLCSGGLNILVIILPVMTVLLISAILVALYYRYQQELKIWLFAKNLCLWWVTEEDLDKDKIYDAFISYSHKDEDFVNQNLLPVLEGKEGYKLCVHYRNWVPGEFIAKQVTNSVCESRRTIIVLSTNFLESVWGKLEFRTAHTQAMTEGRARVIVLLYGEMDVNSLDNELKMYLKTNTYVKWGDPYFWDKLKYALPHSHKRISNSQRHANMMNFIDDKFKLVAPVTTSPGTTPPVLSLDPSLLKKHPLSFVSSPEMDTTPPAEAGTLLTVTTS